MTAHAPESRPLRFFVHGMHCAGCVSRVEQALDAVDGTCGSSVNLATHEAQVRITEEHTEGAIRDRCRLAIEAVGFQFEDVADEDGKSTTQPPEPTGHWRPCLILLPPALAVFALSISGADFPGVGWVLLALSAPVVLWGGRSFFAGAWQATRHRTADMNTLIAIGTGTSFVISAAGLLLPVSLWTTGPPVYFESAVMITVFVLFGRTLEERARWRTSTAIDRLLDLSPKTARVSRSDGEAEVSVDDLQVGDVIIVRPGQRIPVDGVIVEGQSAIDESSMTGESIPVARGPGDTVIGATTNQSGSFTFRAERVGDATLLRQIVDLVRDAQTSKAPIARLADRVSAWFVPAVLLVSAVTFGIWCWLGTPQQAFLCAVAVLVISCPCALGLATPTAIMVAVGRGAERSILIRSGEALETLARVDTIAFDKTGTLTEGRPVVSRVVARTMPEDELLCVAAAVESRSEHPLAGAIVKEARKRHLTLPAISGFQAVAGLGAMASVNAQVVLVGSPSFLRGHGVSDADDLDSSAGSPHVDVAIGGQRAGRIELTDTLRPGTRQAISELQRQGIQCVMITGDNAAAADAIARLTEINTVHSEVLPDQKLDVIRDHQEQQHVVAMTGDGINDSPALAQADVGIAIGTGTDIAIEAADVTLVRDNLTLVVDAVRLARQTMRTIRQNLFFALVFNSIGIPLAAGVLYPFTGFLLPPMFAAGAMALSSVSVVTNSLRLRGF